ncbi:MAG: energy-coupling factor ABC transporter permease [Candidatus Nanopelagicales bacterium]
MFDSMSRGHAHRIPGVSASLDRRGWVSIRRWRAYSTRGRVVSAAGDHRGWVSIRRWRAYSTRGRVVSAAGDHRGWVSIRRWRAYSTRGRVVSASLDRRGWVSIRRWRAYSTRGRWSRLRATAGGGFRYGAGAPHQPCGRVVSASLDRRGWVSIRRWRAYSTRGRVVSASLDRRGWVSIRRWRAYSSRRAGGLAPPGHRGGCGTVIAKRLAIAMGSALIASPRRRTDDGQESLCTSPTGSSPPGGGRCCHGGGRRRWRSQSGEHDGLSTIRTAPLAGLVAVFIFAAQMINFPVGAGTSGHLIGAALAAILVGPYAAVLALTVVLIVQALLFADGGLTALGLNIVNMAIIAPVVAWVIFRLVVRTFGDGRGSIGAGAWFAGWLSVLGAVGGFLVEFALGGTTAIDLGAVVAAMLSVHVLIGAVEGVITALIVLAVAATRPDLVAGLEGLRSRDNAPVPAASAA